MFELPSFPVVCLPRAPFEPREKVPAVSAFAGERPAAWVEDIVTDEARTWSDQRAPPILILEVNSASGLADEHVQQLLTWVSTLRSYSRG